MAHVTLVRPGMVLSRWAFSGVTCPPLGMAYVAASLRAAGHAVTVIDGVGEAVLRYEPLRGDLLLHGLPDGEIVERIPRNTDVIGFSLMFSHEFPVSKRLIRRVRASFPHAFLVAGGEHASAQAKEILELCPELDAVAAGEGEETAVALLDRLIHGGSLENVPGVTSRTPNGTIHVAPRRDRIANIDDIPAPAWDLFDLTAYFRHGFSFGVSRGRCLPLLASRGCPYECTFCSSPGMWTRRWSARDPQRVLDEIIGYIDRYDVQNIDFFDLTAILSKRWFLDFGRRVLSSGYRFTWQLPSGTRSEALDEEVIDLLVRSGCRNITYAPESGSPRMLGLIKKRVDLGRMQRSMRHAVDRGLSVRANIILGMPGETHRDVRETLKFVVRLALMGVHDTYIGAFCPYPGSEVYEQLRQSGRISRLDDDYYFSLLCFQRLWDSVSWNEDVSSRSLVAYRILGTALFYSLSFLIRPARFLSFVVNLLNNRDQTRIEKGILDMVRRFRYGFFRYKKLRSPSTLLP